MQSGGPPGLRALTLDSAEGQIEIETLGGRVFNLPIPDGSNPLASAGMTRSRADLRHHRLELSLESGETLSFDLGWPGQGDLPQSHQSVVYLDQNHWVDLARSVREPASLNPRLRAPATVIVERARSREIILPLSAANLFELPLAGKRRRDLAIAMLELSHGWQMRNPLRVRHLEILRTLRRVNPEAQEVITLEPGAIFAQASPVSRPADFPPQWQELHVRMTSAAAAVAGVLDELEPHERKEGLEAAKRWAQVYGALSKRVARDGPGTERTHEIATEMILADLQSEIATAAAEAGFSANQLTLWFERESRAATTSCPNIGTLIEVLYHRLRNPQRPWTRNDMSDTNFLSCAAAYSDVVVTEKYFGDLLARTNSRRPLKAEVFTSLSAVANSLG